MLPTLQAECKGECHPLDPRLRAERESSVTDHPCALSHRASRGPVTVSTLSPVYLSGRTPYPPPGKSAIAIEIKHSDFVQRVDKGGFPGCIVAVIRSSASSARR